MSCRTVSRKRSRQSESIDFCSVFVYYWKCKKKKKKNQQPQRQAGFTGKTPQFYQRISLSQRVKSWLILQIPHLILHLLFTFFLSLMTFMSLEKTDLVSLISLTQHSSKYQSSTCYGQVESTRNILFKDSDKILGRIQPIIYFSKAKLGQTIYFKFSSQTSSKIIIIFASF